MQKKIFLNHSDIYVLESHTSRRLKKKQQQQHLLGGCAIHSNLLWARQIDRGPIWPKINDVYQKVGGRGYNILYPLQHGFRARRSCETQLIDMINNIVSNMQQGLQTDLCVLDFSKAFDNVGHKRLVEKLKWYGVDGEVNSWIREFLSGRSQSVVVDGASSINVPVISGVPQGSILGPCLFLCYISDIALALKSMTQ